MVVVVAWRCCASGGGGGVCIVDRVLRVEVMHVMRIARSTV